MHIANIFTVCHLYIYSLSFGHTVRAVQFILHAALVVVNSHSVFSVGVDRRRRESRESRRRWCCQRDIIPHRLPISQHCRLLLTDNLIFQFTTSPGFSLVLATCIHSITVVYYLVSIYAYIYVSCTVWDYGWEKTPSLNVTSLEIWNPDVTSSLWCIFSSCTSRMYYIHCHFHTWSH